MAYPQDGPARQKVVEAVDAGNIKALIEDAQALVDKAGRGSVNVSGKLALLLAGAPDMYDTIGAAVDQSAFGGRICGMMLGYMVFRGERPETRSTASLNSALRMVEEGCRLGGWKGGSRQNIKQHIWPAFRPVAHLWAAYQFVENSSIDVGASFDPQHLKIFLWTAEWFRRKGEALVPPHGREAILSSDETWKLRPKVTRDWPAVDIGEQHLDNWDLRHRVKPHRKKI